MWSLRAWARGLFACALVIVCGDLLGKPSIPANDSTVLERVPAAEATERLRPLRERLAQNPSDLPSALDLAKGYLEIGRETADPRFTSYSQATLAPWLGLANPPPAAMVLGATALQSLHEFDHALAMLERAVAADPGNAQAWLTLATILQVQGKFEDARRTCAQLSRLAGQLVALTCMASVNSLNGRLASSYAALKSVYVDDDRLPVSLRSWVMGQMAEMAVRLGDTAAAERHFRAALRVARSDVYLKSDYADLLLMLNRPAEVVALLRENEQQDNLLLRLAIAGQRARAPQAQRWADQFEARYQAARRDRDFTHLREQARFVLEVKDDAPAALKLALQNWQVQKEPADVRILLAAARRTGDQPAIEQIEGWIRDTRYEDRAL